MWASSWALNGFTLGATGGVPFSCHWIEDELSAKYDITHGLGLAILLPRYMDYCLNEETAPIFRDLAVNVLDVDPALPAMIAARKGIETLEKLFFETCGLRKRLRDCGIMDDSRFAQKARVACRNNVIHGLADLTETMSFPSATKAGSKAADTLAQDCASLAGRSLFGCSARGKPLYLTSCPTSLAPSLKEVFSMILRGNEDLRVQKDSCCHRSGVHGHAARIRLRGHVREGAVRKGQNQQEDLLPLLPDPAGSLQGEA